MAPRYGFPKKARLCGQKPVSDLFEQGNPGFVYPFRVLTLPSPGPLDRAAVLISVPKRNHKRANTRNLIKRRIREAYRLNAPQTLCNLHIGLIYISKQVEDFQTIQTALQKILYSLTSPSPPAQ